MEAQFETGVMYDLGEVCRTTTLQTLNSGS